MSISNPDREPVLFKKPLQRILPVLAALSLVGCGDGWQGPQEPSAGIVYDKDDKKVNGTCIVKSGDVCVAYAKKTEYHILIGACRRDYRTKMLHLADRQYLERAEDAPSDFRIIHDGTAHHGDKEYACGADIKVDKDVYERTDVGEYFSD